jgi:acetoin utilization deacetylase AcuC-like enzyme
MTVAIYTHPACLEHRPPSGHPERPARLAAVLHALEGPQFAALERREAPCATQADLRLAHPEDYLARVARAAPTTLERATPLDPDTWLSCGTLEAAARAAGAGVAAVDAVLSGEAAHAFCAVRPPGHHAEATRAMGFCIYANAAIAALHARAAHGRQRVAVVDFDVHHGNGTQAIAWNDPDFFFASSHEGGIYPGTGALRDCGAHAQIINAPLRHGADGTAFRAAWRDRILPALEAFRPEMIIVSAGFDGHLADPLAGLALDAQDFAWATTAILDVAQHVGTPGVVSLLEGGYDLDALAASAAAHVGALLAQAR